MWDHPQAYRMVAEKTFAIASKVDGNSDWFGTVEPLCPLRALDKLMWWAGGVTRAPPPKSAIPGGSSGNSI